MHYPAPFSTVGGTREGRQLPLPYRGRNNFGVREVQALDVGASTRCCQRANRVVELLFAPRGTGTASLRVLSERHEEVEVHRPPGTARQCTHSSRDATPDASCADRWRDSPEPSRQLEVAAIYSVKSVTSFHNISSCCVWSWHARLRREVASSSVRVSYRPTHTGPGLGLRSWAVC